MSTEIVEPSVSAMAPESRSGEDGRSEVGIEDIEDEPEYLDSNSLDCVTVIIDKLRRRQTIGRYDHQENWFNPGESFPP